MNAAYADPPYLGYAKYYDHPESKIYDDPEAHRALIARLDDEYDAWALSLHAPSLRVILPMCPGDIRVLAWVKPFASWKPSQRVVYAWEPILVRGCRGRDRGKTAVRDWAAINVTLKKGLKGAKPAALAWWLFDVIGLEPGDTFVDMFPGSGVFGREWERFRSRKRQGTLVLNG